MKVAIIDDIHRAYDSQPAIGRLRQRAEVHIFTEPFGPPEALRGFDAIVANRERTRFPRELLEQLPDLRILAQTGVHAYHIDFEAAEELGITVARAMSAGSSGSTAELTFGMIISMMRHITTSDTAMKRGDWPTPLGLELGGRTIGVIGLGNLGQKVSNIAHAFNMPVLAWSRSLTAERAREHGAELRPMDDLLRESDVVTVHVPLTVASRGLIGAREIGLMKPTAYLVNTSRGPIVTEAAVVDALQRNAIAGAALDVFDQEPLPLDHPFRSLPNVLLTPHLGWPTDGAYGRFAEAAADVLIDYLDGKPVPTFNHER
jgi:phosphoglycerate dehydrogenase-like enzyme